MKIKHPISFAIYVFLCFLMLRIAFMSLPWREGRSISYDPAGYYLSLPAYFIYDDMTQFAFYDSIGVKYNIGDWQSHVFPLPNGDKTLKYSLGMAVLYSPAFLVANVLAPTSGFEKDGYSQPYYFMLSIWSLLFAFIGLYYLRKVLLQYFDDLSVAAGLFLLVMATNYLPYAAINNLMSHSFLFTLYALLIYFSFRWHQDQDWVSTVGIGLTIGLLALARPTEIISALIPVLFGVVNKAALIENLDKIRKHWPKILTAILVIGAIGSIQLIYWKLYTGHWLYYSYQDQGFDFLHPHIWDGLFSFRKGWLIYTPLMIFAILGFYQLYRTAKGLFLPFLAFFLINIYIVYSWAIWWYGGSVGSRAVVQSYAVMAFPLTALIQNVIRNYSTTLRIGAAALAILLIDLNLMMTWQSTAPGGSWHSEYMTGKYYRKIIGKTVISKDHKKFLDVKYELGNLKNKDVRTLLFHDFEVETAGLPQGNTTDYKASSNRSMKMNSYVEDLTTTIDLTSYQPSSRAWVRLSAKVFYTTMEWNEWRLARLKLNCIRDGQVIGAPSIRLQWLSREWVWHDAFFDYPLKKIFKGGIRDGDQLQIVVENHEPGVPDVFVDDLKLELIDR